MAHVILKAVNIERTIEWYAAAGFELTGRHSNEDQDWCEVQRGGTTIQFLSGDTPWGGVPTMTGCVYVPVADAEQALLALHEPAVAEWGIEGRPWGAREVVLRDPDGYFVTLADQSSSPAI